MKFGIVFKGGIIINDQGKETRSTPFALKCKSCGGALNYDIVKGSYSCSYCHEEEPISKHIDDIRIWAEKQSKKLKETKGKGVSYICSNCGARVNGFIDTEVTECDFCRSSVVKEDFILSKNFPIGIIPFNLTKDEAINILEVFLKKNKFKKQVNIFKNKIEKIKKIYLPYQLYSGPIDFNVIRHIANDEIVPLSAHSYVNQKSIVAYRNLPNDLMDIVEPFDFTKLKSFRFEYLAGINAKTQDININNLRSNYSKETTEDLKEEYQKKLKTPYIDIEIEKDMTESVPVLLPIYYTKFKDKTLVMNGQTGKIAINTDKKKKSRPWIKEALLIIFGVCALMIFLSAYNNPNTDLNFIQRAIMSFHDAIFVQIFFPLTFLATVVALSAYSDGKEPIISDVFITSKENYIRTVDKKLKKEEKLLLKRDIQKPIFYGDYNGEIIPVKVNFNPVRRTIKNIISLIIFIWLPSFASLILFPIFRRGEPFENLFKREFYLAGGVWFALSVPLAFISVVAVIRRELYGNYYIKPLNKKGKYIKVGKTAAEGNIFKRIFKHFYEIRKEWQFILLEIGIFLFFFLGSLLVILL